MPLRFVVINDGSPIDFYISHGSNGGQQGKGRATVIVENVSPTIYLTIKFLTLIVSNQQNQYTNDQITDNNWNTVWFYQKPVSGKAEATNMTTRGVAHSWNNLLNSYLIEIGVKAPESDDTDNEVGALDALLSVTPSADPVPRSPWVINVRLSDKNASARSRLTRPSTPGSSSRRRRRGNTPRSIFDQQGSFSAY